MNLELPPSPHGDVITVHDVVAWRFPDESAPVPAAVEEARRAAAVICVSEFSAREATEFLGITEPHVVHNGVDARFFDADPASGTRRRSGSGAVRPARGRRLAPQEPRGARRGMADRPPRAARPQLVLAGPPHRRRTALFDGMPGRLVGRLPDEVMPGLVAGAEVVVVPSLYEGFGLPALEAMAANVPVVAAATSSLPEVVGDAGILVEPTGAAIAAGLLDATAGAATSALCGRPRPCREFTWERCAEAHARVWASVA